MEVFTGGDHSNVVVFSDTPDQHNKLSADHNHYLPHPPQKLRPIRCTVRTSFTSDDAKPLTWHPASDSDFFNNTQIQIQPVAAAAAANDDANFTTPQPFPPLPLPSSNNEDALSSSSSEISKSQDAVKEPVNKKNRKRKSHKKLKSFVKNMMNTVLEKQEEMHKQLIELIEKKETESIMREQAWKQQEIERARKHEQARKQEMSHSLALISFIQKSLGQDVKIPNFPDAPNQNEVQTPNPNDALFNGKQVENQNEQILKFDAGDVNLKSNGVDFESNNRRWPKSEVQALITVRAAVNQSFNGAGPNRSIWEEVSARLCRMGYHRTPKKCKEKWENMNKYYRRSNEKGSGTKSKVCTYFSELEMLYKSGLVSANSYDDEDQHKAQEERAVDVK
ncbi:trihelix transcription factor GTL2-like [Rutidosis leptorrhynchoides]|uniref:trihelix transcription factor GTL2-like n=1 Tax=Rutidosis leptorrhynchoides TaxID=125765 RepID=UPI003A9A4349